MFAVTEQSTQVTEGYHGHHADSGASSAPPSGQRLVEHLVDVHGASALAVAYIPEDTRQWLHEGSHQGEAWVEALPGHHRGPDEPYHPACLQCRAAEARVRERHRRCLSAWTGAVTLSETPPRLPLAAAATEAGMTDDEWFDAVRPYGPKPGESPLDLIAYLEARCDGVAHVEAKTIAGGRWSLAHRNCGPADDAPWMLVGLEDLGHWVPDEDGEDYLEDLAEPYGHHAEEREAAYDPWLACDPDSRPEVWD